MYYDDRFRQEFKEYPNAVIAYLLMASWLYYFRPSMTPILSDEAFDKLCLYTYKNFDKIEHRFKHLLTKEGLRAGSLYSLGSYDYPRRLIEIAERLSEELNNE